MARKPKASFLVLAICFFTPLAFAQGSVHNKTEKQSLTLLSDMEPINRAIQEWNELALLLTSAPSQEKVQTSIDKEIMFDGYLVTRSQHALMLGGVGGINFKVKISQSVELPIADSDIVIVLGQVERISRDRLTLTIRAEAVKVIAAE